MNPVLDCLLTTVSSYPEKTAIADKENSFTFSALASYSARLGNTVLRRCEKVGAVGVFVNRNAETAVLFLSVLYAGGFYVPLDPDLPSSKLSSIIEDAGISLLLGSEDNRPRLSEISFNGDFLTVEHMDEHECSVPDRSPDSPLFMVYTSGSTGKPKGVLKSHGAMINFIDTYTKTFEFSSDDVIGNQTPFFFDASAKDLYLMIKCGATIQILPSELFSFPVRLIEYMNEKGVTFICWVPTALCIVTQLNTFMEILPTTLKKVFFVGEVMPRKHLDKWMKALPHLKYVNLYGSSEIAGICCYYEVSNEKELSPDRPLPLGRPLSNCTLFLTDNGEFVTEQKRIGEICISSEALALCYYNDKEKTDSSFVTMTLPDGSVSRVFKTGDMASFDEHGDLSFAARKDFQIKHMGRRIELGEIEAIADTLPSIRRCCCHYNPEKKHIILFCELTDGYTLTPREIKTSLKGHLTDYMMPAKVIVKDALPINANGKIDRQKLKSEI